ncbi:MAG TPA: AI-2E family transporter [Blastocatellia bacterium]|nr:AI-2E family transporter [Blastocatellia bacterium]
MSAGESRQPGARVGAIDWMRWVPAVALALLAGWALLIGGRVILVPLLASLALAYLLEPAVRWFERRGWSRAAAALLALIGAALALTLALIFVIPGLWAQLLKSYAQAQTLLADRERVEALSLRLREVSPALYEYFRTRLLFWVSPSGQEQLWGAGAVWLQSGVFRLANATAPLLDLLLIPFFVYYLLSDYRAMRARVELLVPPRHRPVAAELALRINHVLSSYVRNQLLIALVMGLLYALGFAALRVPLALTLGLLSGLLNFIPYLGTLTGLLLSMLFVALDGAGLWRMLGVLGVFTLVQSIEGYYLTPRLLGSRLNLHPLWVLAGLVVAGHLFGLLGIILAIPVLAAAKVVLEFLEESYHNSQFYRRPTSQLLTEQGMPVELAGPREPSPLTLDLPPPSERPRRVILTTGELRSRLRQPDQSPPED